MRLKKLVALCLLAFVFSAATIIVAGIWIVPKDKIQSNITTAEDNSQPAADLNAADPAAGQPMPSGQSASASQPAANNSTPASSTSAPAGGSGTASGSGSSNSSGSPSNPPPSNPPPSNPPPSQPACGSAGGTCTAAEVAAHNGKTNCWVIYNGSYYIVTSYVNQHPGGSSVFNSSTCGHDISSYLNGSQTTAGQRKNHPGSAYSILNSYKVGPMQ